MELLKQRIINDGKAIGNDVVKVDMFLNHLIEVNLLGEIGKEFRKRFPSDKITKILTIEASGIGIACVAAQYFDVPVLFAKKGANRNIGDNLYKADVYSFTKGTTTTIGVSKDYLSADDHVLIIDDFMANGKAVHGLLNIIGQAGASVEGIGIVIEKGFQPGGDSLRSLGYKVESLAIIKSIDDGNIIFG